MSTTTKTFTRPMLPHGMLRGKTAIVTGGGTGLGKGMALEYARLGANVAIAGRREDVLAEAEAEIARHGGGTLAMKTDVRKPEDVDAFVEAVGNFVVPSIDLSANGWRAVIDIVLNGTWFFSQRCAKEMIASGNGGTIVNIGATYAWTGNPLTVHSAAAKAGVLSMTQTLAVEWAPHGIRVNMIAPGPIAETGAVTQLFNSPEKAQRVVDGVPLKRLGEVEEVANVAAYLVSDFAAYVTGACIVIDGGRWLGKGAFAQ
jgi:NAD(P)-dependent dehydrogenase (short-subunit alcohol dehydrogenase family)